MALLQRVRDGEPRLRLLFPHPTPDVHQRLKKYIRPSETLAGARWSSPAAPSLTLGLAMTYMLAPPSSRPLDTMAMGTYRQLCGK